MSIVVRSPQQQLEGLSRVFPSLEPSISIAQTVKRLEEQENREAKLMVIPRISINGRYEEQFKDCALALKNTEGFAETISTIPGRSRPSFVSNGTLKGAVCGDFMIVAAIVTEQSRPITTGLSLLHVLWLIMARGIEIAPGTNIITKDMVSVDKLRRALIVSRQEEGWVIEHANTQAVLPKGYFAIT